MDLSQSVSNGMLIIILVVVSMIASLKIYERFKTSDCISKCCTWHVEAKEPPTTESNTTALEHVLSHVV